MRYVMIGNSYAAFGAIEAIRQVERDSPITVISDEPYPCYARPLITFWLGGSVTTEHMFYRPADYYESHHITPIARPWRPTADPAARAAASPVYLERTIDRADGIRRGLELWVFLRSAANGS